MSILDRALRVGEAKKYRGYEQRVARINDFEPEMELLDDPLYETFALVREASRRTLGLRHFDVQLIGGMVLHDGAIAEMRTGEGKTLTATLAVVLNALAGKGVHLLTGFDYLRDNMATTLDEKVQHGGRITEDGKAVATHNFAIVDEVDNILIDEARTPLIISGAPEQAADLYDRFAKLAPRLVVGEKPEGLDPRAKKEFVADYDYEFDEKHKTVSITERGVAKAEKFLGIDHLYKAENGPLVNHLIQALKAESLYKRDVDYAVVDGEVKIIDEFTGRILDGRRWSEGLHQAVEAKEGVRVREENQTLATITLQNYFRMYDKLAGMSGTALTEATEFMKIYKVGVVEIPTNRPMIRKDQNDQIYKTQEGKWRAVASEIAARHQKGQPVLVGTISVEVSELLSENLRKRGVPHSVLNAKPEHAEREGEIIAEAGRPGAVTIATNMAGRGVDIKLGGNAEHQTHQELASRGLEPGTPEYEEAWEPLFRRIEKDVESDRELVKAAGGLYILGPERHESRRIDNQLRGRSGRQGDPGESRFYLSAEDDLVRLFAGERIYKILDKLGPIDKEGNEQPIEAGMLSKQIENAQKKVEEQNFLIRKRVLEYDDVMNQQREVIYEIRDRILEGEDMSETARTQIADAVERLAEEYLAGDYVEDWDVDGLLTQLEQMYPVALDPEEFDTLKADRASIVAELRDDVVHAYDERESELGAEVMRALERYILLQIIDDRWREHLHDMDYLREGIHLRSFAQIDPLVAYKNEGFEMFTALINSISEEFARYIFRVEVEIEGGNGGGPGAGPQPWQPSPTSSPTGRLQYQGG